MASPVIPADLKAALPSSTSSLCGNFTKALLQLPVLFYKVFRWMLADDGSLADDFTTDIAAKVMPTGSFLQTAAAITSDKFLLCDGSTKSIASYPALAALLGTAYGGDGVTVFGLPDCRGRFLLGVSVSHTVGSTGGEETHTLTNGEMPSHHHHFTQQIAGATGPFGSGTDSVGADTITENFGGGDPHNNMPPFISALVYIRI